MGAKTALLVYTDADPAELLRRAPAPDRAAVSALVAATHPGWTGAGASAGSLLDDVYPPEGFVYAGSFPGIDVLCDQQVMIDHPSQMPGHLLGPGTQRRTILHAMHSVVDWFAYAIWEKGDLVRSLSLDPSGILEDIGTPLPFEAPFWAGEHAVAPLADLPGRSANPPPFHPLDLGDRALRELLGFAVEGRRIGTDLDAGAVRLIGFEIPAAEPITAADVEEFARTRKRTRYTLGPGGSLVPIED